MSSTRTTFRSTLALAALVSVAGLAHPAEAAVADSTSNAARTTTAVTSARLAGADRSATSVAISRYRFPAGARNAYLVNASAAADAIAAGMVDQGPILLVPGRGPVPASVLAEIRRLNPATVTAIGGTGVVPGATLVQAAQGRRTARFAGADRYGTAAAIAKAVYRKPVTVGDHATFFVSSTPTADGVVVGVGANPYTPVLPLPATGPAPAVIKQTAAQLAGGASVVVGGTASVSDATFASAAPAGTRARVAGPDRYATAVSFARITDPGQGTVYLARGDVFADALAAGTLKDGPVLLVPKDGTLPNVVAGYLDRTRPTRVIALGGTGAVSDRMLTAAKNAAAGRMPTADVLLRNPYPTKDHLAAGWTVEKQAGAAGEVAGCAEPSPAGKVANTYYCAPSAAYAIGCYAKTGYSDVVTCVVDPWRRRLAEYRTDAPLGRTGLPARSVPLGVSTPSLTCSIRDGGAWSFRGDRVPWTSCENGTYLWTDSAHPTLTRTDGNTVQYLAAPADPAQPFRWVDAQTRYYLG